MLRDWGQKEKYQHILPGFNYRMDSIQGAALGVKLNYIEDWTESRRRCAHHYGLQLTASGIPTPAPPDHCRHVYHVYAVQVEDRAHVQAALQTAGIATGIHYPIPVHLQLAYDDLGYQDGDLPVTERMARCFLSLPMYAELPHAAIEKVAAELTALVGLGRL
jgi:dTDP-4-amino-4,6-dideoxygalactose transaminase